MRRFAIIAHKSFELHTDITKPKLIVCATIRTYTILFLFPYSLESSFGLGVSFAHDAVFASNFDEKEKAKKMEIAKKSKDSKGKEHVKKRRGRK